MAAKLIPRSARYSRPSDTTIRMRRIKNPRMPGWLRSWLKRSKPSAIRATPVLARPDLGRAWAVAAAPPCGPDAPVAKQSQGWRQWPLKRPEYQFMSHGRKIAVIGLGYVGLPVAAAFARTGCPAIGFDIDAGRVAELTEGKDRTREVDTADLRRTGLRFTSEPGDIAAADFFIVTVPTPIDSARRPDLGAMLAATRTVAAVMKRGDIVVYESTVYPGAVEEDCVPLLEGSSGLSA